MLEYPVYLIGYYEKDELMYGILVEKCDSRIKGMVIRKALMQIIRWTEYMYNIRTDYERALQDDRNTGVLIMKVLKSV